MEVTEMITQIDAQISKLQKARELLGSSAAPAKRGPGRPKSIQAAAPSSQGRRKKREITPEGRKRIADAMKRRWAERRKAASS